MKKYFNYAIILLLINACVELPDLIPNEVNGVSDMNVYTLDVDILNETFTWPLVIDDNLTLNSFEVPNIGLCGNLKLEIDEGDGQILSPKNFTEDPNYWLADGFYDGLTEGELVNGFSTTTEWKSDFYLYITASIFGFCLEVPSLNTGDESYLGFRFKIDNEWHYGWILFESNALLADGINYGYLIKKVAYNKSAGTNVRIGG